MFVKLFTQILDSSIADDRRLRHFFTDLLLCADGEGFVMMTEAALARRIGASPEEVAWGLSELQKPDPRSKTPDHKGKRIEVVQGSGYGWHILNYEHYRAMKDANQLREAVKLRVQRHRAKKAGSKQGVGGNATVTRSNAGNAMQKESQSAEGESETDEKEKKTSRGRAASRSPSLAVDDEGWLCELEGEKAYAGITIRRELGKCQRWCLENHHQPTRRRFVNWLNRADKPLTAIGTKPPDKHAAYNAETATAGKTAAQISGFTDETGI